MNSEIVVWLQGITLALIGIGVKGIISINVHLAKLNGKVHELEMSDVHIEGDIEEVKKRVESIDRRCIDVLRSGGR